MNIRTYEVHPFNIDKVVVANGPLNKQGSGLSEDAKQAILNAFQHVAWIDEHGQEYYDDIYDAFYPPVHATSISLNTDTLSFTSIGATQTLVATVHPADATDEITWESSNTGVCTVSSSGVVTSVSYGTCDITVTAGEVSATCSVVVAQATLVSINVTYTQSGTVYDTDSLDSLKSDLLVVAVWSDSTQSVVASTDYTLSGTLTEGTSTITVSYAGKSGTFNVTVTAGSILPAGYTLYDYIRYTGQAWSSSGSARNYIIATQKFPNLDNLIIDFDCRPHTAQTSATGLIGGHATTSGNAYGVTFYGRTDTQRVSCFSHGSALGIDNIPNMQVGKKVHVHLDPGTASPSTLTVDSLSVTEAWTSTNTINEPIGLFGQASPNSATLKSFVDIGVLRVYNVSDESLAGEFYPCVRDADNVMGIYDTVSETFYTASNTAVATIGNTNCMYTVGNWED